MCLSFLFSLIFAWWPVHPDIPAPRTFLMYTLSNLAKEILLFIVYISFCPSVVRISFLFFPCRTLTQGYLLHYQSYLLHCQMYSLMLLLPLGIILHKEISLPLWFRSHRTWFLYLVFLLEVTCTPHQWRSHYMSFPWWCFS